MFPGLFFVFLYSNVYQGVHLFTQVVLKFPDRGNEGGGESCKQASFLFILLVVFLQESCYNRNGELSEKTGNRRQYTVKTWIAAEKKSE